MRAREAAAGRRATPPRRARTARRTRQAAEPADRPAIAQRAPLPGATPGAPLGATSAAQVGEERFDLTLQGEEVGPGGDPRGHPRRLRSTRPRASISGGRPRKQVTRLEEPDAARTAVRVPLRGCDEVRAPASAASRRRAPTADWRARSARLRRRGADSRCRRAGLRRHSGSLPHSRSRRAGRAGVAPVVLGVLAAVDTAERRQGRRNGVETGLPPDFLEKVLAPRFARRQTIRARLEVDLAPRGDDAFPDALRRPPRRESETRENAFDLAVTHGGAAEALELRPRESPANGRRRGARRRPRRGPRSSRRRSPR